MTDTGPRARRPGHRPRRRDQRAAGGTKIKLGAWVSNQRSRAASLSPDHIEQLSNIGMRWTRGAVSVREDHEEDGGRYRADEQGTKTANPVAEEDHGARVPEKRHGRIDKFDGGRLPG
ncbi:helicase associated domain-containing protein [Streptomyces echinatus]|uniref:helicase associated domain-containing protein n=1 Tax=Streptomyces echinatus TaxID=67293 RepID=UPI0035E41DA9